ncbi:pentatricopeptide repeat-containing protein At1g14470 [Cucurbita moschata]|uniref:Pentatricopeptide repeat-containing protein At1g14470 n=1 Tax=Cucurbita moschata TaxID=3662 RepID=A0A6J1FMC6_CUCMO|nr:pentatricopeptide repeat-containing protein At1g14470 [Cucurbita moschata]
MYDLVAIATKISNISQLRQLHAHLVLNSLQSQNYWVSLLLTICTRLHAHPSYAASIFTSSPYPNASVYSCMLKYYSRMGAHDEVVSLFRCMQCLDLRPHPSVYIYLIKLAGKSGNLFHASVLKLGHIDDHFIRNAVLDMYAKYGQVDLARKLFEQMPNRTLADWNSMISGCWNSGNEADAVMLFNMMPDRNTISWTAMVTGYAKRRDLESARRYFDEMPEKSVVSWNAMLSAYAQNECAEEALKLFHRMLKEGITPDDTTWVAAISSCSSIGNPNLADSLLAKINQKHVILNNYVKTALLDMHAKFGNLEIARRIFDELGGQRNAVTWNVMISAYTRAGKLSLARELFDNMPKRDVVSWNSMIAGYAQNGESAMSIHLFREMIDCTDIQPDEVTIASVLSACGHIGALKFSYWVLNIVQEKNIKFGISGFNSLIFMYSKCGNVVDAHRIFQNMGTKDVVTFNTLISGFAANGHGKDAIKLLLTMEEEGIEPDHVTYIGVLTACSHAGMLKEGKNIFKSIKAPTVDHYACMVDLLGRAGELDEAKILIESMPMKPHAGVYGSLLNGSRIHKRVELGELAANKLLELEPQNPGNYILLSNIYASAGRWEDVRQVREKMRKGGVKKSVGMSWVEYKGQIHNFTVGDRSHEWSKDIYRLLAELERKMKRVGFVTDKSCALRDVEEEEKEEMLGTHSEKLAICFALLVSEVGTPIRVVKNLRICMDCHTAIKMISKLEEREIIVRDNNRFHCFSEGICSCHDYW